MSERQWETSYIKKKIKKKLIKTKELEKQVKMQSIIKIER